ncbi:MAG: helix-turn-helix domain-containing protein [Acidobacteriaceae bacterium]
MRSAAKRERLEGDVMATRLVRVQDAAEMLCVSQKKVWQLIYSRQLSCVRVGRCVRLEVADLAEYVEQGRIPARVA